MRVDLGVSLRDVRKTYEIDAQKIEVLRGVTFKLSQGDMVAITGKSGAGKSTLLHILGTLDKPSSGQVLLGGVDVATMNDETASRFRNCSIGFVFQMNNLLGEFSAIENVMMPGLIAGHSKNTVRERAAKVLASVGLSHRERHRPGELSGGEQQRVAIARALLMAPSLLLADEPTGNLDQRTSLAIQELLFQLCHEQQMSMVLVTHDLELAKRLPMQIIMEDGKVIDRGIH